MVFWVLGRLAASIRPLPVNVTPYWDVSPSGSLFVDEKNVLGRAPSLRRSYSASTLLPTPPTPTGARLRLCLPAALLAHSRPPARATRVGLSGSWLVFLRPPSPHTPEEPDRLRVLVASRSKLASPSLARWPL